MIVDASDACSVANFDIGGSTTTSRQWTIKVTQYACGDYDKSGKKEYKNKTFDHTNNWKHFQFSGWPGCLQYYTSTANHIFK